MALNLKAQCAESGVLVWASTQRPMKLAIGGHDWEFINTRVSGIHQPQIIEFPILVPIGTVPVAGVIVIFIGKSNSNPVLPECPQFLDEPIIQLPGPFARKEGNDLRSPRWELGAIAPFGIGRVSK